VTVGYALGGTDAGNYTLTQPTGLTASITAAMLTITGQRQRQDLRWYTAATLSNLGTLTGYVPTDNVSLSTGGFTANFPSKNVGNNLTVTVSGYALAGPDAGNYTLTQPTASRRVSTRRR